MLWRYHQCCIQDLAGHRQITDVPQGGVKALEQLLDGASLG